MNLMDKLNNILENYKKISVRYDRTTITNLFGEEVSQKMKKHGTNKIFSLASDIAKITATKPARWLRYAEKYEIICERGLNELKERSNIRNKAGYLIAFITKTIKTAKK